MQMDHCPRQLQGRHAPMSVDHLESMVMVPSDRGRATLSRNADCQYLK